MPLEIVVSKPSELHLSFNDIDSLKTVITGEGGSGKTLLTVRFLVEALARVPGQDLLVIDFAPPSFLYKSVKIGGMVEEYIDLPSDVKILKPEKVYTPRVSKDPSLAGENYRNMEPLIDLALSLHKKYVFVNDVSLYLQAGTVKDVRKLLSLAPTMVINGYLGRIFEDSSEITKNENKLMHYLSALSDLHIHIEPT